MRPLQRLLYVRICVRARDWLCMHACVVSLTPLPLLFRIILQCDDLFLSFCVVLDYLEDFCLFVVVVLFCFVFTFLLFNLSFIYVCVGFFFLFWDFITSSCAFTIYKRNAGLMVRQQVKSASPWVCMFMWCVIWRERHHSFRSGVCVCVSLWVTVAPMQSDRQCFMGNQTWVILLHCQINWMIFEPPWSS